MIKKNLYIKESQIEELKKLSEKTGAPVAELIRRAIEVYLKSMAKG